MAQTDGPSTEPVEQWFRAFRTLADSTDPVEQWIRNEYTASVVLVEMRPKNIAGVKALWDKISPIRGRDAVARELELERRKLCRLNAHATGFVVKTEESNTWILSCAHILSALFDAKKPMSARELEDLYDVWILCDHCEQRHLQDPKHFERDYTPAQVAELNCRKDLLLLRITRGEFQKRCERHHRAVPIAQIFPVPLARTVLLSWPHLKARTVVSGKTIHESRAYGDLTDDKSKGYNMSLSEVDISSEFGSSGAPLITGEHAIGVLQSGNTMFSYFVSLEDLRATLQEWRMID